MNNLKINKIKPFYKLAIVTLFVLFLTACTTFEYHETKVVKLEKPTEQEINDLNEDALLDIAIVLFDEGVDELDEEAFAYANLRRSEAVWFSSQLRATLEKSKNWGLVRTLPLDNGIVDVMIRGQLLESNGEIVKLLISAEDSTGRQWFSREYDQQASQYAYNPEVNIPGDPFQALFNEIANDLAISLSNLTIEQRLAVRNVTKLRFAQEFVPQAFDGFLTKQANGELSLQRIPAKSDPMMQRVERIQARNDLYLDVVQDYYRAFNRNMSGPYNEWRKSSYKEVVYERQLREQARKERIAGVATLIGGIALAVEGDSGAARTAGHVGIFGGAQLFRRSYSKADEANIHREALLEMGASLEAELETSVVELQDRSVTLSGTVEDQYKEWRRILTEMFTLEEGVPLSESNQEVEFSSPDVDDVLVN